MKILPLKRSLQSFIGKHQLEKKWRKQSDLFETNWRHPSLHTELLEPKELRIFSFRVDRKYRAIFVFNDNNAVEIIDINNHYSRA